MKKQLIPGLLLLSSLSLAQPELEGYFKFNRYLSLLSPYEDKKVGSKLQIRFSSEVSEYAGMFAAFNVDYNYIGSNGISTNMVEGYVEFLGNTFDVRFGNQLIFWGKTDWLTITDRINPWNFTVLSSELEDLRLPVPSVKLNYYKGDYTVESVWILKFISAPLMLESTSFPNLGLNDPVYPKDTFENFEVGIRLLKVGTGFDWSASYLYGWDDYPTLRFRDGGITPMYYRTHVWGIDFAKTVNRFLVVGEGAYTVTEDEDGRDLGLENPNIIYALGSTYRFSEDVYFNLQFVQRILLHYRVSLEKERQFQNSLFSSVSFEITDYVSVQFLTSYDLDEEDYFLILHWSYSLTDGLAINSGAFLFGGEAETAFGRLDQMDFGFVEVKYSF